MKITHAFFSESDAGAVAITINDTDVVHAIDRRDVLVFGGILDS